MSKQYITTIAKYAFSLVLLFFSSNAAGNGLYLLFGIFELALIFITSNLIVGRFPVVGQLYNILLLLVFNLETMILIFSGQYLRLIMLTNINSLASLSGDSLKYIMGFIALIVFTALPITHVSFKSLIWNYRLLSISLIINLITVFIIGTSYSPINSVRTLYKEYAVQASFDNDITDAPDKTGIFYQKNITSYTDLVPFENVQPNVILIFAEGLSQNVVVDNRDIMPNVKKYEQTSINFVNYFNHTSATYRGIISQLYSGYQKDNLDSNSLISMQKILEDEGYQTAFINTEPKNADFSMYLKSLGFMQVVSDNNLEGFNHSISDKHAFELLYDTMEKLSASDKPFFLSIYTFGTHNTFDSTDELFGDGNDRVLNKFYNLDVQFGSFMDRFASSKMFDNTIIIFTADHCTYNADDYRKAFPDYTMNSTFLDTIPLLIYYNGVAPMDMDAAGRNSLDMAPTVLDLIGVSAPNYFLGTSLFNPDNYGDSIENLYYDGSNYLSSRNSVVSHLESDSQRMRSFSATLNNYFIAKQQKPTVSPKS